MPKIRGFKPDLWTDETFVDVQPLARLLWMGLWSYACDNGHLDDKSKQIKLRVLPMEDCNVAELLRELEDHGLIVRGDGTITIPNFAKHQRPDKRYFQVCDLPRCAKPSGDSQRETRSAPHETTTSARGGHDVHSWGPHVDGDGDGEVMVNRGDGEGTAASKSRATQLPKGWQPSDAHIRLAAERAVDLDEETAKFRDWCASNGAAKKDWEATFRNWLRNARPNGRPLQVAKTYQDARTLERPPDGLTDDEYAEWAHAQAARQR